MAGWLSRATEAFRREPPAPEPFDVGCDCGNRVTGDRSPTAQRIPCPGCGRLVFVLPANVYPRPAVKTVARKPASKPGRTKSVVDGENSRTSTAAPSKPEAKPAQKGAAKADKAAVAALPDEPRGIRIERRERVLTPFRLIVVAILVVSGLTGWGLWHRHRVETAKAIVAPATEAGTQALREGDFTLAARELERAREAVDLLRRSDSEAQTVRRLCREAVAARDLAGASLFDLLKESLADLSAGDKGSKQFDMFYRGSWVLFDAPALVPDEQDQPCVLDLPLTFDGRAVRIEANFPALRQAAKKAQVEGTPRVIFAAQLTHFAPPADEMSDAVLTLGDDSAFLWSDYDTYAALGYREDNVEEQKLTRAVLQRQLEVMEAAK